jgi:hypothetical protein
METQREYETRELRSLAAQLAACVNAPLADRKEAQAEWRKALVEAPDMIAERVGWLIEGCYGFGAYLRAQESLKSRGNRPAQLALLLAPLDFQCPQAMARAAFASITEEQQERVTALIALEIEARIAQAALESREVSQ